MTKLLPSAAWPARRAWADAAAELRSNRRLRLGVGLVLLLLAADAALRLSDATIAKRAELAARTSERNALLDITAEPDWEGRRQTAEALRSTLLARIWEAETDGLALAAFQDWLFKVAQGSGLRDLRLKVEPDTSATAPLGLRTLSATLAAPASLADLEGFLAALASGERLVTIERLHIRTEPAAQVEMELRTYFRLEPAP